MELLSKLAKKVFGKKKPYEKPKKVTKVDVDEESKDEEKTDDNKSKDEDKTENNTDDKTKKEEQENKQEKSEELWIGLEQAEVNDLDFKEEWNWYAATKIAVALVLVATFAEALLCWTLIHNSTRVKPESNRKSGVVGSCSSGSQTDDKNRHLG